MPSPKSIVVWRNALEPVGRVTVKTTVAVLFELTATAAQLPVPAAGVQLIVRAGPDRAATVTSLLVTRPAVALTRASWAAVSVVRASPLALVSAVDDDSVPWVELKVTSTPGRALPSVAMTLAINSTVLPVGLTLPGLARTETA